jgi:hypothetical protein
MDDLKKFQTDLDQLMVHTRRRLAMLDGMSRFITWMADHARDEDRMMGHFILREHNAPRSPFLTAYPDQGVDAGFEPEPVEETPPPSAPPPPPSPEDVERNMLNLRNEMLRRRGD